MRESYLRVVLAGYASQALVCALIAVVLALLWRTYRRGHLALWSLSFAALGIYQLLASLVISGTTTANAHAASRSLLSATSQLAGYLQAAWLLLGTWELASGRSVPRWRHAQVLLWIVGAAAVVTATTIDADQATRLMVRIGLRSALCGIAFIVTALALLRMGARGGGAGRTVLAFGLAMYGLEQFHYAFLTSPIAPTGLSYSMYLGTVDVALQSAIGLGMVGWHLEEERRQAKASALALRASEQSLLRAHRLTVVGRLASGLAHDFRNLLTVLSGTADAMRDQPDGSLGARLAEEIEGAVSRGSDLSSHLLALARGRGERAGDVDLGTLVREMVPLVARLGGPDIVVRTLLSDEPAVVHADRGSLEMALLNLVANARDACPGGGELTIGVRRATRPELGDAVEWIVRDTGTGLTAEARERLFEPFFSTKGEDRGTGLGLSDVQSAVVTAGGSVSVEDAPGGGTQVRIVLPRVGGRSRAPVSA